MSAARHLAVSTMRRWLAALLTVVVFAGIVAGGYAYYIGHAVANSNGGSLAGSVNKVTGLALGGGGITPTANPNVPLQWNTTTLANGGAVAGYVVNRVLPTDLTGRSIPPYFQNRLKMQGRYLEEIDNTFGSQVIARVPEMERDVTGLAMIEKLAGLMYANGSH